MSSKDVIKLAKKLSDKYFISEEEANLLLKIENSPFHFLPRTDLTEDDFFTIQDLLDKKFAKFIPAHGMFQDGYATTSAGSTALGTFDFIS